MRLDQFDTTTQVLARVAQSTRITPPEADEVRELLLDLDHPDFTPVAGQTVGVLAPADPAFGHTEHFRLYTVADRPLTIDGSTRITLAVRRCNYVDEYSGERYEGRASNYLCDLRPGDTLTLTGPYGHPFPVPANPKATLILIGMGTGIAPFRALVRHIYEDRPDFQGRILLFHGGLTGVDLLYRNDARDDFQLYYDRPTFEAIDALAVHPVWEPDIDWQTPIQKRAEEIARLLGAESTYVYVAGLEAIREQLEGVFAEVVGGVGEWERRKGELVAGKRWIELLY